MLIDWTKFCECDKCNALHFKGGQDQMDLTLLNELGDLESKINKMNALRAKLYQEYLDSGCSGIDAMRLEVADRIRGIFGIIGDGAAKEG